MSMKIRLARGGSKKRPFYSIVATDSRNPRDGRFLEKLGTYNPLLAKDSEERVKMNVDRVKHWRNPVGPFVCAALIANQVLPDLDQHMGEPIDDGVAEHRVAAQRAVIRLVVANGQRRVS